jgi:hypothetical protein
MDWSIEVADGQGMLGGPRMASIVDKT